MKRPLTLQLTGDKNFLVIFLKFQNFFRLQLELSEFEFPITLISATNTHLYPLRIREDF